jgi:hypothetical protein
MFPEFSQDGTFRNPCTTNPKRNPSESIVHLSVSLTVFLPVVLLSVGSHWFPSASTPCSLANYTAETHQQHPCIIQRIRRSPIDWHCIFPTHFCLLLNSPFPLQNLIVLLCSFQEIPVSERLPGEGLPSTLFGHCTHTCTVFLKSATPLSQCLTRLCHRMFRPWVASG